MKFSIRVIMLMVVAAVFVSTAGTIILASGVLLSTAGIIYLVLILVVMVSLVLIAKKFYQESKDEKKLTEMVNNPRLIFNKLKEHGTIIDDGHELEISLKEDKVTGKEILDVKRGKVAVQPWRDKYNSTQEGEPKVPLDNAKSEILPKEPKKQKADKKPAKKSKRSKTKKA